MTKFVTWARLIVAASLIAGCANPPPGDFCDLASAMRWNDPATFEYLEEHEPELLTQMLSQNRLGASAPAEGGCGWIP